MHAMPRWSPYISSESFLPQRGADEHTRSLDTLAAAPRCIRKFWNVNAVSDQPVKLHGSAVENAWRLPASLPKWLVILRQLECELSLHAATQLFRTSQCSWALDGERRDALLEELCLALACWDHRRK